MKKILTLLSILTIFLFSCNKENLDKPIDNKHYIDSLQHIQDSIILEYRSKCGIIIQLTSYTYMDHSGIHIYNYTITENYITKNQTNSSTILNDKVGIEKCFDYKW